MRQQTLPSVVAAPFRPVTHVASGGLYALAENDRLADSMLHPLRMRNTVQPPPGTQHRPNGQPPGGDSPKVAQQATRVGAGMVIRMPDIYPNFPYRLVSWDDWLSKVDTMVNARLAATTVTNVEAWELWNEPDWTWNTAAAGDFNAGWVRTFQRVRLDGRGLRARRRDLLHRQAGAGRRGDDQHRRPGPLGVHTGHRPAVTNGEITISVPNMNARHGYHLVIQPTSGMPNFQQRYEAENASVFRTQRRTSSNASNG